MTDTAMTNVIGERDIAIIGMAGRFPKAKNLKEYWENLINGVECVTFFSDEELAAAGVDRELLRDPNYIKAAPVLDDIDKFDAAFFGYTPNEAAIMDPQQRFFLELAWQALEDAGCVPEKYNGLIGVYASVAWNTYLLSNLCSNTELFKGGSAFQVFTTNDKDFMPTRISYKFNLKGPSMIIQTACSSSLVATHLAALSLLNYECDMAIVGGSTIKVPHKAGYYYQEGSLASPDGHCRSFDAQGQGTVFGSGAGVVILKRALEAFNDGDHIYAVIKGSAINNDGSVKVSYTAPSVEGQAEVVAAAQSLSGIEQETIGYIETHGTGTSLGDPIEVTALNKVFQRDAGAPNTHKKGFCAIGSVKSNIGHLDSAAGIAGLIKTTLALQHKMIPPSLNYEKPNPKIDFASSPFFVNQTTRKWETSGGPRRAGVSSFGVGGTNAHVILEEAPEQVSSSQSRPWQLFLLSAKTVPSLEQATVNLADYFKENPDINPGDAAYTLQTGRTVFSNRRFTVCRDIKEAAATLQSLDPAHVFSGISGEESNNRPVVFMFTGEGPRYRNMGLEIYQNEAVFRENIDLCAAKAKSFLGLNLREVLYPTEGKTEEAARLLNQTAIAQPVIFALEYALAKLFISWGITPRVMIGQGTGEYVAACLSGVFSLDDALRMLSRLRQAQPTGTQQDQPVGEITKLSVQPTSPVAEPAEAKPPTIPFISSLTGTWITDEEATDPAYWIRHSHETSRFDAGIDELLKQPDSVFMEIGPDNTLCKLVKERQNKDGAQLLISALGERRLSPQPLESVSDLQSLLKALGQLWLAGAQIDWGSFYAAEKRRRVSLPAYAFERNSYWIEPKRSMLSEEKERLRKEKVEKSSDIANWFYTPSWNLTPPLKPFHHLKPLNSRSCWLVFGDAYGTGKAVYEFLHNKKETVVYITAGEQFSRPSDDTYIINVTQKDDYVALLKELTANGRKPDTVIHMLSISQDLNLTSTERFENCRKYGFASLVCLAQAINELDTTAPVKMSVVSNYVYGIHEQEPVIPEKSIILGPCKVMPQEYANITCRFIDLSDAALSGAPGAMLADQILAETVSDSPDFVTAYRGKQRWIQDYQPARLEDDTPPLRDIREKGVFLITGGLYGAGLAVAEYLAKTVKARLVLIDDTRAHGASYLKDSDFPAPGDWERWLATHGDQDEISLIIRKFQAFESYGAEVSLNRIDFSGESQFQELVNGVLKRYGAIHGVVHAVEVDEDKIFRLIPDIDEAHVLAHFQSKVDGLRFLDKVLKDVELDFAVVMSSLAAVLSGLGYSAYTSASLFLDAFTTANNAHRHLPWLSVNWDAWRFGGEKEKLSNLSANLSQFALTPAEGTEAFRLILSGSTVNQVIVSTGELKRRMEQLLQRSGRSSAFEEAAADAETPAQLHPRPKLQTSYTPPENELEEEIAAIWAKVFGFAEIGTNDNFFDLGGDSLIAIQVVNRLKKELNREISAVSLYQALTVKSMAELLAKDLTEAIGERAAKFEEQKEKAARRKQIQKNRRSGKSEEGEDDGE